ncbi:MAG: hypothetical protein KDK70_13950 [Myxococcales bacterium]|nr:hypothetical protein [Myxococcales bacterium]
MPRSSSRRSLGRRLLRLAQLVALGALAWVVWERVTFERAHWHADYRQLRAHLEGAYANLLWARDAGGVDLVALDARTRRALDEASTDRQARAAIAEFLAAFHDGHLRIDRVKLSKRLERWWAELGSEPAAPVELGPDTPAAEACAALGFGERDGSFGPALREAPGLSALPPADNGFAAATLDRPGKRWGLLRIHSFDAHAMGSACQRAWEPFREGLEGPCDEECRDRFVYTAVPNRILAELTERITALQQAGIDALLVDLMHNGGGNDWVDPAARLLTARPLVCPRLAFIRHPHWSERLRAQGAEVDEDLRQPQPEADLARLRQARARLDRLAAQAEARCELSSVWTDPSSPGCSNLVEDEYYACGLFGYLEPGSLPQARTRGLMFEALRYDYTAGIYQGPLVVLVDGHTASAAEYFAAMLQDDEAAVVVGERTHGSGCGYTSGGVPVVLEHSELRIVLPDCQRRRRDGSNELAGIAPDRAVGWQPDDDPSTRAQRLLDVLDAL